MKVLINEKWRICISLLILIAGTGLIFSCSNTPKKTSDHPQGTFSISGAFALYPLTVKWVEEFRKDYPDIRIDVSAGGAGKGMVDVLANMVDLGMFSREVTPSEVEKGAWYIAVAKDAVVATINQMNPVKEELLKQGLSQKVLRELYMNEKPWFWREVNPEIKVNSPIHIYTRSDACGAAQVWASYMGTNQESLKGVGVFGDPGMADAIKKDLMGLGYNNIAYAFDINTRQKFDGIEILPIDFNENGVLDAEESVYQSLDSLMKAIGNGRYPSPPARELYFISKGKPDNELVNLFLKWVLTKGQQYVDKAGYVKLSDEHVASQLLLLTGDAH